MGTDIRDAGPMDIYVDSNGKLWRVVGVCMEPTVIVEEIEPEDWTRRARINGGISGAMWNGWRRIYSLKPEQEST